MNAHVKKTSNNLTGYISIFSKNDWKELDSIMENILINEPQILESPQTGDSRNEDVNLQIARFIVRKDNHSKNVNELYTSKILGILKNSHFIELVEKQANLRNLKILRMQLNSMKKDAFVGIHTDKESDPIYELTVLIRTASDYSGGELCIYGNNPQIINQKMHSVFMMDPCVEHEVKPVLNGRRNSIVIVLGKA